MTGGDKGIQGVTRGYRGFQKVTGIDRALQGVKKRVTSPDRGLQGVFLRLQGVAEGYRGQQGVSRGDIG